MDSEDAVRDQISASSVEPRSAISSEASDPLANAYCPNCGYSLRGLPENRCPECGTAFDPSDIAGAIAPVWPRLLFWYMTAMIATSLIDVPAAFRAVGILFSQPEVIFHSPFSPAFTGYLMFPLEMALICLVGALSLWGLHRGRDWARWTCMLVFLAQCLTLIANTCSIAANMLHRSSNTTEKVNAVFLSLSPLGQAAGLFLLLLFLATGLRRRSLAGRHMAAIVRLPRSHVTPMRDWALLGATIIAGLAATYLLSGIAGFRVTSVLPSQETTFVVAWSFYARVVIHVLIGVLGIAAVLWIRRKPEVACSILIALYVLSGVPELLDLVRTVFSRSFNKWEMAPTDLMNLATSWVFALAIFLFVRTTWGRREQPLREGACATKPDPLEARHKS